MYYVLTRDGLLVGVFFTSPYQLSLGDITVHEFDGPVPDLNIYKWDDELGELVRNENSRSLTRLQFTNRLTISERIAASASTDPVVADIMRMLTIAEYVNLDDPTTIQAMQYLTLVGIVDSNRLTEILQ